MNKIKNIIENIQFLIIISIVFVLFPFFYIAVKLLEIFDKIFEELGYYGVD